MAVPVYGHIFSGPQHVFWDDVARRNPQVRLIGESKARRHHADDCHLFAVDVELTSKDVRVRAESSSPQALTDDCYSSISQTVFICIEDAADDWRYSEYAKQIRRGDHTVHALRHTGAGEVEAIFAITRDRFEACVAFSPIDEIGARNCFEVMQLLGTLKHRD